MPNQQLPEELHKPVNSTFEKWKRHSSFTGNTWTADLADMQWISRFNKEFRFLSFVDLG